MVGSRQERERPDWAYGSGDPRSVRETFTDGPQKGVISETSTPEAVAETDEAEMVKIYDGGTTTSTRKRNSI